MKHAPLFGAEGGEQFVFHQSETKKSNGKFLSAGRGEFDDVTSSVNRIAPSNNQISLFEFIQKSDNVARVETQCFAEDLLAQGSALVQESEGVEMSWPKSARQHGSLGGAATNPSQVIEQRQRLIVGFRRDLVHPLIVYVQSIIGHSQMIGDTLRTLRQ